MILEKYVDRLNAGDADGIAALFTEDCRFDDGGARLVDSDDLVVRGRENLKKAFTGVFEAYTVRAEIISMYDHSMQYDVFLGDIHLPCIGAAWLKDGLIDEYIAGPNS